MPGVRWDLVIIKLGLTFGTTSSFVLFPSALHQFSECESAGGSFFFSSCSSSSSIVVLRRQDARYLGNGLQPVLIHDCAAGFRRSRFHWQEARQQTLEWDIRRQAGSDATAEPQGD